MVCTLQWLVDCMLIDYGATTDAQSHSNPDQSLIIKHEMPCCITRRSDKFQLVNHNLHQPKESK